METNELRARINSIESKVDECYKGIAYLINLENEFQEENESGELEENSNPSTLPTKENIKVKEYEE